jgi:hypothetical protein
MSITRESSPYLWGLVTGAKPPDRLPLSQKAAREVYLADSQYGAKYDPDMVPAHAHVLDAFQDPRIKEIANVAVTGFGKTTIFEVAVSYVVAENPGPAGIWSNSNHTTKFWMESRMLKVLKRSPWTRGFLPTGANRNDAKKDQIIFAHMALSAGGANKSNTQEKSLRYCFGDEVWEWDDGLIEEVLARHHNRMNRKALFQSQGGDEGTEWHKFCLDGKWHEAHHRCPSCEEYFPVTMGKNGILQFEKIRDANGEYDWPRINESIRLVCPGCGEEFADTDTNRKRWAICKPVWNGNKHKADRVTFTHTFLTVWNKEWSEVVFKWIEANDQIKRGNLEPMRQFVNKRLGQFFVVPADTPKLDMGGEPYSKEQYHNGEIWEGEHFRFMHIDVQKGHFWAAIRACKLNGGGSRLLWEGKVDTWQTLFYLQERYGVENPRVHIDGGYEIDEIVRQVTAHCGKDLAGQWQILIGEDSSNGYQYEVGNAKKPRKVWKIFSKWNYGRTSCQLPYRAIRFSNLRAKDALKGIMAIGNGNFGVPVDVSKEYVVQMASEIKKEFSPGKWRWEKIKSHYDNHLWDNEVGIVVAQAMTGVLKIEADD